MNLDDQLTVKLALQLGGAGLVIAAAFAAWIYAQFIKPSIDALENKVRSLELTAAERTKLPARVDAIETDVRAIDKRVVALESSESQRLANLNQGLAKLEELVQSLRHDLTSGDLEARIASAETLVRTLQVAETLAKLQSAEARERIAGESKEAEQALVKLRAELKARPRKA